MPWDTRLDAAPGWLCLQSRNKASARRYNAVWLKKNGTTWADAHHGHIQGRESCMLRTNARSIAAAGPAANTLSIAYGIGDAARMTASRASLHPS